MRAFSPEKQLNAGCIISNDYGLAVVYPCVNYKIPDDLIW